MRVTELNNNELYQLKDTLYCDAYYNMEALPGLTDEQKNEVYAAQYPDDISDQLIFDVYSDIYFVEEDFWCNV